MYFLLTNDDGISSPSLRILAMTAVSRGHRVLVAAPSEQQSAASQRIHLNKPLMVKQQNWPNGIEAWAVTGSPADCVRLAMELSEVKPDLCISGINDGENAGCAIFYSGTVAAAREAAMHYLPAFAVSIMPGADDGMVRHLAELALDMAERSLLTAFPRLAVVNINAPAIPADQLKGIRYADPSTAFYRAGYEARTSPRGQRYYWLSNGLPMEEPLPDSDYGLLRQGYITVSILGGFASLNQHADHFINLP